MVKTILSCNKVIKRVSNELETRAVQVRSDLAPVLGPVQVTDDLTAGLPDAAEQLLARAQSEADQLLLETNRRISALERSGYEEGWHQGRQEGLQEYQQLITEYHRQSQERLGQINEIHQRIYEESEQELVGLAVQIAQKLVCRQLDLDPGTVVDIVRTACQQARECERVIIYTAPAQLESLKSRREEIENQLYRAQKIDFIADPAIELGGCRLETEHGYIDATIDTMLEQIKSVLRGQEG